MSGVFDATQPQRFFRPADATRVRRNLRRIQFQRLLAVGRNALFVLIVIGAGVWAYRHTQSDARFAVRHIEVSGAARTSRAAIDAITQSYSGLNLFQMDIARVQHDLGSLAWIERIAIEKRIPDTLRINVIERTPVALLHRGSDFQYVDGSGVIIANLTPAVGDADLPVVTASGHEEILRTVRFLEGLRNGDPTMYSRVAQIRPMVPRGFAIFDRELGGTVFVNDADGAAKWRNLYSILSSERLERFSIEYADLRFVDRIVVKPVHPLAVAQARPPVSPGHAQITN